MRQKHKTHKPAGKEHKASFNDSAFQKKNMQNTKADTKAEQMTGLKYKPN